MSSRAAARIAALVLAAGSSERMGADNKMLLPVGSETLLRRAVRRAAAAGLDPVVVVTGHGRTDAEAEVAATATATVFNADHAEGIHTSVRAGIAALADDPGYADVAAAIIMLADMPLVSSDMLRALADCYRAGNAALVISRYGGEVQAPPVLYGRALFGELRRIEQRGGREVIERHRGEAAVMEWPRAALADVDTPDDLAAVRATIEQPTPGRAGNATDTPDES